MPHPRTCYAALAIVNDALTITLAIQGALLEAACIAGASVSYAGLCISVNNHPRS